MSAPVRLLLGFHAHQPVGNFPFVIDAAQRRCYGRFIEILERHPRIRFSLHISGWLLDYLVRVYPEDVARIAGMVRRGQVEIVGGGDTEPILAAIPERDRRDQLRTLSARIDATFGVRPRGAWLAERVWEATVAPSLADCGIHYVAVDDYHFLSAGKTTAELTGYFTTEESGKRLDLFPIAERLRYMIPFTPAADVVAAIEAYPDGAAAIYFDDIEKFGIWPDTFEWVYERGWLEDFLVRLEASARVTTQTFGEFHDRHASCGLVYLPTTSYAEMNEWTLPAAGARRFRQLAERSRFSGTLFDDRPYIRGGTWKNFFSKYAEANWMHKRMEQASRRFHMLSRSAQTDAMRSALHRAQANDAYWHGLFGGLYLPFLRRSVYANLAALEAQLDPLQPRPPSARTDVDLDGVPEIELRGGRFYAALRPLDGGCLRELTDYPLTHNFADVLARRDEEYYDEIRNYASQAGGAVEFTRPARSAGAVECIRPSEGAHSFDHPDAPPNARGIASIHERSAFKDRIEPSDLEPDRNVRGIFVDSWYEPASGAQTTVRYQAAPQRGEAAAICRARLDGVSIEKSYRIERDTLLVRYTMRASRHIAGALAVEINLAMPSADGPGGTFLVEGARHGHLATKLELHDARTLVLDDRELGGRVEVSVMPACELRAAPLVTVSRSESGYEKIVQATTLTLSWVIALEPGERAERSIMLRCVTTTPSTPTRADAPAARETDTSESGTTPSRTSADEDRA